MVGIDEARQESCLAELKKIRARAYNKWFRLCKMPALVLTNKVEDN